MPKTKNGNEVIRGNKALEAYKLNKAAILEAVKAGATHKDLAKIMNVGERTLEYMLHNNPTIEAEIVAAAMRNVNEVKSALFMRATGQCKRTVTTTSAKGSTVTTETIPPDITAIRLYLTNYDPDFKTMTREEAEIKKEGNKIKRERLEKEEW